MREYEVMLILPADADDAAAVDGLADRIRGILAERGGEIRKIDKWGRRRLAYEIARQSEGYYVVVSFSAEPEAVEAIDRMLTLADEVIRFKVVLRQAA
jgi:small subunit ribosomal protein S6